MHQKNRFVTIASYSHGKSITTDNFRISEKDMPAITATQVLIKPVVLSIEPTLRGMMNGEDNWYLPQYVPGEPIRGMGVAKVIASDVSGYKPGDFVQGFMDWSDYCVWDSAAPQTIISGLFPVHPAITNLSLAMGAFGLAGYCAYIGIEEIAKPAQGDIVLISSAAGGVGIIAGQLAKRRGATVIGLTSSQEKRDLLTQQLGFDMALDYRSHNFMDEILRVAPNGPDIYFDNVGGALSQTIMHAMRYPARIIECGQIATYDDQGGGWMMDLRPIHSNGLTLTSVAPPVFMDKIPAMIDQLVKWENAGIIKTIETEYQGLDKAPLALVDLMNGKGVGKVVVELED